MLGVVPKRSCLTVRPPAAAPDSVQPIVAEAQTYVGEDEWPATVEASVAATAVTRVPDVAQCLYSTSEQLSEWTQEDLDTWEAL